MRKIKSIVQLVRKEYDTIHLVKTIKMKNAKSLLKLADKTFSIDLAYPVYNNLEKYYYVIDIDSNTQLKLSNLTTSINPNALDLLISNHIIKDLTNSAILNQKDKIILIVMGAVMGALLSLSVLLVYLQSKNINLFAE